MSTDTRAWLGVDYAAMVDASDDAIISKTLAGVILSWNRGAVKLFGYEPMEVIDRSIALLVPPGRDDEEPTILQASADGKVQRFDTVRRRKDGTDVDVSVTISPVRDESGKVVAICKIARDITTRKRAERELAGAKDRAESASQELRTFGYSVAHDLRAPLRGIQGFAGALLEHSGQLDAEGVDHLHEICGNARRMGELIDAMLSLSQVTHGELRHAAVDLSSLFRATALDCQRAEPPRQVEVIAPAGILATADPRLTRTLVENLVGNAWKFTRDRPGARMELGVLDEQGQRTFFVRDNGAGFDMGYVSKLFRPFQRLHGRAEFPGTGIGLATVERIVQRHGGAVRAEGHVGRGATIFFTLPDPRVAEDTT